MQQILIVNSAEPGISERSRPIFNINSNTRCSAKIIEYKDCLKTNLSGFNGAIITGSPQGNNIVEHHLPYFEWIKYFDKPVFGICAGHHITGFMYGAKLFRSKEPESGVFGVNIVNDDPVFFGMNNYITVKQMHNDSIGLPAEFILLASSKTCKNQMMKHKNKPLYTSQFHPEFYNHNLLFNFLKLCQ